LGLPDEPWHHSGLNLFFTFGVVYKEGAGLTMEEHIMENNLAGYEGYLIQYERP
jgi:hypothetical protein